MSYLLDTCILSNLRKIKAYPDEKLKSWFGKHSEIHYFISILSIGEIQKGISRLPESEISKKMIFEDWLIADLIPRFEGRIMEIDMHTALVWGKLCGEAQKRGHVLSVIDSLLAATAIRHDFILVTVNFKDFIHTGCRLLDPIST